MNNGNTSEQSSNKPQNKKANFQDFAGSVTCANCHKEIYETHVKTGHYLTSRPASEKYIKGNLEKGKNIYPFHPGLFVAMEKRDSGLFQVAYLNGIEKVAHRFDIVTGSGAVGQTYLSWKENELYQLPISYLSSANEWANSPGFPGKVIFNRPVTSRCLECHSTYAKVISPPEKEPEDFDRRQIIYGVDCEKCHGPAAKHVDYQTQHPGETIGKYIINPSDFSRQQSLDLCALCHGGRLQKVRPSFTFTAGENLSHYFMKSSDDPNSKIIDVHGNQLGLLSESKCFRMSKTLTCVTCHNSHENESGNITLFSQRCITCHSEEHGTFCKMNSLSSATLKTNCVDCHMPKQLSKSITVLLPGAQQPTSIIKHTHLIKIYPEEVKKVISVMKQGHQTSDLISAKKGF